MPIGHLRHRPASRDVGTILTIALGGATAVIGVLALRRRTTGASSVSAGSHDLLDLPANPNGAPNGPDDEVGDGSAPNQKLRWLRVFFSVALPPTVVTAAILTPIPRAGFVGRVLIIAGVELVLAAVLRRKKPGRSRWVTIALGSYLILLWIGSALALLGQLTASFFFFQDQEQIDPVATLVLVVVGILVLCIPAVVLVAQAEFQPTIEPVLFAAIAIVIGGLCLPAIDTLTRTVGTVDTNDSVTLYVSSVSTHFAFSSQLTLPGIDTGQYGGRTVESIGISDADRKPFRWALLLQGGARLTNVSVDPGSHVINLGEFDDSGVMEPVQLISGDSSDGIISFVLGETVLTFASDTISRRTVVLPSFLYGGPIVTGGQTAAEKDVLDALAGTSTSAQVAITVDAGPIEPQDTISSISPAVSNPGWLRWQAASFLSPSFTLVDANRADTTQNVLFTIAVLLGVSGSALLMAIQSALSYLSSGSKSDRSKEA